MRNNVNLFAGRLAELRKGRGLTQQQFADQLADYLGNTSKEKISFITISSYERGNRMPIVNTLIAMATFFDVSLDYLTGLDTVPAIKRSEQLQGTEDRPIAEPDILIDVHEYNKYHLNPVFIVFPPDKNLKPRWGILDFEKSRVVCADGMFALTPSIKVFRMTPVEEQYTNVSFKAPLTVGDLMETNKPVWVELVHADAYMQGKYNGWYEHNEDKTCIINKSTGYALPYYGCGQSYNAFNV